MFSFSSVPASLCPSLRLGELGRPGEGKMAMSGGGGPHPLLVESVSTGDRNDQRWLLAQTLSACVNPLTGTRVLPFIQLKTKMEAVKRLVSLWISLVNSVKMGRKLLFPALDQIWQLCSCSDSQARKCCLAFWCWHVSIPFHISLYK